MLIRGMSKIEIEISYRQNKITGKCDSARIEINIQIFQNLGKMKSGKTERRKDGKTEKREDG